MVILLADDRVRMACRALIGAGRHLVVLADHTKWGVIGISAVSRLEDADTVITDSGLDADARTLISSAVRTLVLVDPPTGAAEVLGGEPQLSSERNP
jgi:DeoR/GlpR family transcriptional regulator of sugar metabolism